jgi:thiol-disulfide isomerase/thioredoxin
MKYALLIAFCMVATTVFAQIDTTTPPYKRFPTLPPVQLLLSDSTTKFTKDDFSKKKPVLLMLFSPDCSHCQKTAEEMLENKDKLTNIQIVMATLHSIEKMNDFVTTYRLNEIPGLVIGKDLYYILPGFFNMKSLPFLAFYNKKGELIRGFEGSMDLNRILQQFK